MFAFQCREQAEAWCFYGGICRGIDADYSTAKAKFLMLKAGSRRVLASSQLAQSKPYTDRSLQEVHRLFTISPVIVFLGRANKFVGRGGFGNRG